MSKAWMPLFVGDYLGDTCHLTQGQHGAYMLLLMHYWQRGPIPCDPIQCYCIARAMDEQSRCNVDSVLYQFFTKGDNCYRNHRLDTELEKAKISYERRVTAANARWKKVSAPAENGNGIHALQMQSTSMHCDSDSNDLDLEKEVLEIAKLYPKIADPLHLSREHAGLIMDAVARHNGKVLEGTRIFRSCFDNWASERREFAPGVRSFFEESQYLFDETKWDKSKKSAPMPDLSVGRKRAAEYGKTIV